MDTVTTSQASPGSRRTTRPTPSTCPWTTWPPSRVLIVAARSMLTLLPTERLPRELRRSVSSITSPVMQTPSTSAAVRQTPLTATESPMAVSARSGSVMVSRAESDKVSTAVTVARLSTMPVNISMPLSVQRRVDPHVRAEPRHVGDVEADRVADRRDAGRIEHRRPGAEQGGGVVADDAVDEPVAHERPGQCRSAFQKQQQRVAFEQLGKQRTEVEPAVTTRQLDHIGGGRAQRLDAVRLGIRPDHDRRRSSAVEHPRGQRRPPRPVDDHAQWLPCRGDVTDRELWVVGKNGADADDDGVGRGP